jgi:hypothetical protein
MMLQHWAIRTQKVTLCLWTILVFLRTFHSRDTALKDSDIDSMLPKQPVTFIIELIICQSQTTIIAIVAIFAIFPDSRSHITVISEQSSYSSQSCNATRT